MTRPVQPRPVVRLALSRAEVAVCIGVSVGSVDTMVDEGVLPPPRRWHSRKLWLVSEIETYLHSWPVEDRNISDGAEARASHLPEELDEATALLGFTPPDDFFSDAVAEHPSKPIGPLHKRERQALVQFAEIGVGVPVPRDTVKGLGFHTELRLLRRQFIEALREPSGSIYAHRLTYAGWEMARKIGSRIA